MRWISINNWKKKHGIGKSKAPKKRAKGLAPKKEKPVFKLLAYDTLSNEWIPLEEFHTEKKARAAAIKRLEELAISRLAASCGGHGFDGIHDHIFIKYPDGKRLRVIG